MGTLTEEIAPMAEANAQQRKLPQLPALTSIRYVLAVLVVLVHYHGELAPSLGDNVPVGRIATACVSSFFVLSGFILTYQYWRPNQAVNKKHFYLARAARIVPVYWFTLMLALVMKSSAELPSLALLPTVLATSFAFLQVWIPVLPVCFGVNPPAYSLAIEAFFYLVFPFIIGAFSRRPLIGLLVSIPVSLAVALILPPQYNVWAIFLLPLGRMTEFALGMASCLVFMRLGKLWNTRSVAAVTLMELVSLAAATALVLLAAPLNGTADTALRTYAAKAGVAAFASIAFFLFAINRGIVARALSWAPLLVLGESSYCLYLLHDIFTRWLHGQHLALPWNAPWMYFLFTGMATFFSYACFRFVETPWRKKILSWKSRQNSALLTGQVAFIIALLLGRVFLELPWWHQIREANSKPVVASVVFEDAATLDRLYVLREPHGLEFSGYWRTGTNPRRARRLAVHLLDKNRTIVKQLDHDLMPKQLPLSGTEIVDRFSLNDDDLPPGGQVGLAVYDDPSVTLVAAGGTCDWGSHRLLIPLDKVEAK